MDREKIIAIIKDESEKLGLDYEMVMSWLSELNFELDVVVGNPLFDGSKVKTAVEMAYRVFA
ncbi:MULTISPECIES: hypothetical protein [Bacillus]|nr:MULTISPECIES: hypothetical protein [Bacillus subtilis group]MBT3123409.1 hypothetical protein [Bacillus inaquosorum]MCB4338012.1 hypothetical protein [Bacillus subtilis]MCB5337112.1 hypothetical protein [Bacillus amyloliquefaciens]MCL9628239.1 hypothetical protein [Bacillus subtilis]QWK35362.1 hypothetical protein KM843_19565 [Bacillus velezensis]